MTGYFFKFFFFEIVNQDYNLKNLSYTFFFPKRQWDVYVYVCVCVCIHTHIYIKLGREEIAYAFHLFIVGEIGLQ